MSIKTLSPYYIEIPLTSPLSGAVCNSYELRLYVWDGIRSAVPSEPAYTMTKINAVGSATTDKINIARIVSDFIEFGCQPQTGTVLTDGNNQVWVMYQCYYDDYPDTLALQDITLGLKGYGYFLEGENPQLPDNRILLTGDEFKVSRSGRFVLPFIVEELPFERLLTITDFSRKSGLQYLLELTANFPYTGLSVFVRAVGDTEWTATELSPPGYLVPEDIASGVFEVLVTAHDIADDELIYSEIYTITALKIYEIEPSDGGHAIAVYFHSNIFAASYTLQIDGATGPTWENTSTQSGSPLPASFTPTGDFIARVTANGLYSNEVPFHIVLEEAILIP